MSGFVDPTTKYPVSGILQRLVGRDDNGGVVIERVQVVDQILEEARYLRNYHPRNGYNRDRSRQHVAHIPIEIVNRLMKRFGPSWASWETDKEFAAWLNSSEAQPWRTSTGRV